MNAAQHEKAKSDRVFPELYAFTLLLMLPVFSANADMASVLPLPDDPASALKLPPGFKAGVFARLAPAGSHYFRGPRFMAFGPDGNLYVSLGLDNKVVMLPDANHDGRADGTVLVSDKLNAPQGLAFIEGKLLVANQDGVVRLDQKDGRWPATGSTTIISDLPPGGHALKTFKQGPDGFLYLNVGSSCNVCAEQDPLRATILRYTVDGKPSGGFKSGGGMPAAVWATGLRNAEGFAWHPQTRAMYATNNGADMRSDKKGGAPVDDLPPEHLNRIEPGTHYGWPYCWGEHVVDPNYPSSDFSANGGFCETARSPAITFPAHAAPLGITFLDQAAFPAEYRNDALVALHGSWNRRHPTGYKVIRVHFDGGQPAALSDFVTGWLSETGAWGRPVDVIVGPAGALYLSDDRAGMIYRIVYQGEQK